MKKIIQIIGFSTIMLACAAHAEDPFSDPPKKIRTNGERNMITVTTERPPVAGSDQSMRPVVV
ncbi:MAG: hypothetical protein ABUL58_00675, partial [Steroidobacter sp.]